MLRRAVFAATSLLVFVAAACDGGKPPPEVAAPAAVAPAQNVERLKVPVGDAPVDGEAAALVTLVEFTDYQCPFCSRANGTVKQLQAEYGSKLRVVLKQNPLPFHARAKPAAYAALAAGKQGKYFAMHEQLFANANARALEDADLERYAAAAGLDVARFKADLADPSFAQIVERDQALAAKLGATGTPAFFINGRKLVGAQPIERFRALIDEELKTAAALVESGVAKTALYDRLLADAKDGAPTPAAAPATKERVEGPPRQLSLPKHAPQKGRSDAKVTVVAFSDFQCPFCSRVLPTMAKLEQNFGKDLRFVFRHQPLPFHQNAHAAAQASMAAHEQGKFWEMHDKLFANQNALDRASLERYAEELRLDLRKFRAALDEKKFDAAIAEDQAEAAKVDANGTPTFFINGRPLVGAQPYEVFAKVIEEELKKPAR